MNYTLCACVCVSMTKVHNCDKSEMRLRLPTTILQQLRNYTEFKWFVITFQPFLDALAVDITFRCAVYCKYQTRVVSFTCNLSMVTGATFLLSNGERWWCCSVCVAVRNDRHPPLSTVYFNPFVLNSHSNFLDIHVLCCSKGLDNIWCNSHMWAYVSRIFGVPNIYSEHVDD